MAMKKKFLFIPLIAVLLFGCNKTKNKLVKLIINENTGFVSLQLYDTIVKQPFQFAVDSAGNGGAIYFETANGTQWLKGEPEKTICTASTFNGTWTVDNRVVSISVAKNDTGYVFGFSAEPDSGILKWGFYVSASENEYFTGIFERVVDGNQKESWKKGITEALNLRGQAIDMILKPTVSLYCPFYLSSNGYGLFIEGTWPGRYDFCKENTKLVKIAFEGKALHGRIYTAKQPDELVKIHARYVGPSIIPPKWAFLPYRWRDENKNHEKYYDDTPANAPFNSMLVEDILMMEALDIPCGVYWIDRPWAKGAMGYDDFEWDEERFPNAPQMIKWLQEKDIKLLLWIAPWVDGQMAETARQKNYHVPMKIGDWTEWAKTNELALLDFSNEEAVQWWQTEGLAKVLKQGVKGFKLDRAEELVPENYDIKFANGKTSREMRNAFPVLYVKETNEVCKKIHGNDFVIFPRAGYTGSSKYAVFWGGDIGSPPEGLRCAIISVQRAAIMGFPLWGSDIGGYWQGEMDREVTARWLAFGCFNPVMEFGPSRNKGPWNMENEPNYDTTLIATWRLYAKIHTELADYSLQLAREANETGMPPVRPLFLEYGEQKKAWKDWQTFKYGKDILVSAIWQKGKSTHTCYLPANEQWIDAWDTTKTYDGGKEIEINTPIHKIPIFIRKGANITLGDLNELYRESLEIAKNIPDIKKLEKNITFETNDKKE